MFEVVPICISSNIRPFTSLGDPDYAKCYSTVDVKKSLGMAKNSYVMTCAIEKI